MGTMSYKVYNANELVKEFKNMDSDFPVLRYIQSSQSQSLGWALKFGGWKVEETDDQTKETKLWK